MANRLKKVMKPILKQKCSEAYQEGYKKGMWMGFKQKKMAYESEIECLRKIQLALHLMVPKWVPVVEQLPGFDTERVLVMTRGDLILGYPKMDTDRYVAGRWVRYGNMVTHWMPLPELPKEVE